MAFELPDQYLSLQQEARHLAESVEDISIEADESSEVHTGVLEALRDSSIGELTVPRAYGGRFDVVDPLAVCVVREVLMATSSHLDSLFALQGIGSYSISQGATEELRARYLPSVARFDQLAALALTEPGAGSDLRSISTTARTSSNELVINGEKSWISNAGAAGFYVVLVREADSLSLFLIPADAEGLETEPTESIIAPHVLGSVRFNDVVVGTSNRLGREGEGLDLVLATLSVFRVSVAGAAVGLAQAALDEAVRHAKDRQQFGRPLIRIGQVAALLAESWTDVEQARQLTYRAAAMARDDPLAHLHMSSMAKLAATEAASRVVDRSVQIMGRWGLIHNSKVERLYRQARPMRIYEGASEVLKIGIARALAERTT